MTGADPEPCFICARNQSGPLGRFLSAVIPPEAFAILMALTWTIPPAVAPDPMSQFVWVAGIVPVPAEFEDAYNHARQIAGEMMELLRQQHGDTDDGPTNR